MRRRPPSPSFTPIPKASAPVQKGIIISPKASARALSTSQANFQHLYNVWLQSFSVNTRKAYAGDLKTLVEWREISTEKELMKLLSGMTSAEGNMMALEWQNNLVAQGLAPSTTNRMISALKAFLKLLRMNGWLSWTLEIPKRRAKAYKDTKGCGADAVETVIQQLTEQDGPKPARDEVILRLIWGLGLRRGELAHLEVRDINLKAQKIMILGKGRHEAEALSLTTKMVSALRKWLQYRGTKPGALFWNFSRTGINQRLTGKGIWRITHRYGLGRPHGVRHAAITTALDKTKGDVRTVMRFSRHRDLNTLMIYDDNRRDGAKKISEALEEDI